MAVRKGTPPIAKKKTKVNLKGRADAVYLKKNKKKLVS